MQMGYTCSRGVRDPQLCCGELLRETNRNLRRWTRCRDPCRLSTKHPNFCLIECEDSSGLVVYMNERDPGSRNFQTPGSAYGFTAFFC